ncbi:hypothetical protein ACWDQO_16890 [Streptomyces sp. NPDC003703]|uniref:hypothetical protein n=1 Tax=Streptomyces sp. NPDC003283 TaxID=3364681 RepID=UPI0036C7FF2C
MSDGRSSDPRFDERLSFTPEPGAPVDCARTADGPVRYVEVVGGMRAAVVWGRGLRAHKERGLAPSRAVAELPAGTAAPAGHVAPGRPSEAASDSARRAPARGR